MRFVLAMPDDIGIREPVDFVPAFRTAHEAEEAPRFFRQVHPVLQGQGTMLAAEPKMHVGRQRFQEVLRAAREAGFRVIDAPAVRLSRATLLGRG